MKITIHSIDANKDFDIPAYCSGVTSDDSEDVGRSGFYPLAAIQRVLVLGDGLYVIADLRKDDEHRKPEIVTDVPSPIESETAAV